MNDSVRMTRLPLARFKVIDVSRVRSGPTAVRQLADWGAEVIKVESPYGDGGLGGARHDPDFQNLHRNKRSITLDLKKEEGLEIFERLVAGADVLVENFRPDVKYRLRIDYERMRQINERLVYASISGFGEEGPYRDRPGFDQIAQGMGGLMAITGLPGQGPVRAGTAIADLSAGILCAMGILIALLEREESGQGQWVKTNLLAAQIAMLDFQAARWLIGKERPRQAGNNHPTSIPTGVFRTKDGHINIAASGDAIYRRLCHALGAPHLADDPKFATERARSDNRDALNSEIDNITSRQKSAALIEALNNAGVPCGPIYQIDEMFDDPQVRHLGMAQPVNHPKWGQIDLLGQAVTLNRTPSKMRLPTPECGEHTDAILTELGYDKTSVAALRRGGVI
jgi:crotonobetainyl-CoA:carnitine CoA-transferase CaiB-like acyl-CoA transferase